MLSELHIENFAIIDRLDLALRPGLVTFTGETGAGKSIIIDAVETLMGGRLDATLVRTGQERATIEGTFRIPEAVRQEVQAILEQEDLLDDPDYLVLGREIRLNGRNVARINGRSVSTALLRQVSDLLVDVHGQSEHLSLLHPNQHLGLLDRYATALEAGSAAPGETGAGPSLADLQAAYSRPYRRLQAVRKELDDLHHAESDAARRTDALTFQIGEIEAARLHPGEEEELRDERNRLANAESLASLAQEALQALDESTPEASTTFLAATDLLGQAVRALNGLARLDPTQQKLAGQAEELADGLNDLAASLRSYLEGIEFNPRRLDQVEERLGLLHNLKRKYGDSIPAILDFAAEAHRQLEAITHASTRIAELEQEQHALLEELGRAGQALSLKRHAAAGQLSHAIEAELADLHMSGARFQVDFQSRPAPEGVILPDGRQVAFDAAGFEKVEFMIAPNPGEGFKPLARIASGGETSRLMLALKNVLANADHIATLIFDEIDQGIGGRVGTIVGQKLWNLARQHQVLCITHLPQLAVFGEQHYHVQKHLQGGRTTTQVISLSGQERLVELAQMLGGVSEGTLRSARELVQLANQQAAVSEFAVGRPG